MLESWWKGGHVDRELPAIEVRYAHEDRTRIKAGAGKALFRGEIM